MKQLTFLVVLTFTYLLPSITQAQNANSLQYPSLLKELNRDIWLPYSEAVRTNDANKLTGLLSQDFVSINTYNKKIVNLRQFSEALHKAYKKNKDEQDQKSAPACEIIFRFSERIITEDFASERGVYKYFYTTPHGEKEWVFYKFHAITRKEKGVWKMVSFYYSNDNNGANPSAFSEALPLDHISKY